MKYSQALSQFRFRNKIRFHSTPTYPQKEDLNSRNWRFVRKRLSTRFWRNSSTMNFIARNPNKPEARSQKPEARSQKPEARSQKPEARSQKPEATLKKEKKFKWGTIWGTK